MAHLFQSFIVSLKKSGDPESLPDFKVLKVNSIKANKDNSASVYIGGHEVESGKSIGYPLEAGEALNDIDTELLGEIFISGTLGDKVHVVCTDNPVLRQLRETVTHETLGSESHVNSHD